MAIKKKYLDDDTREELKDLKGVMFNSEEELNEKLDEIHRKRNSRKVSRIMRLLGFALALVLFFAAFDVYFESSFLGAMFTPDDYAFSLESMKQTNSTTDNGIFHGYTKGAKYYVLKNYDPTKDSRVTEHTWKNMDSSDADDYCPVYEYTIHYNDARSTILSPDVSVDYDGTVTSATLRNNYEFLKKYPAPDSPTYDDWWWFGTGFVALLNTIVILGLGILLVYIFVFMIKDFVDAIKFTFIGTRNSAAELIETASGAVRRKKTDEEETEPVKNNKKLFDDEELVVTAPPKKKRTSKKVEESKDEEKKETQPLYNDDELDRLLKGENISTNTETETDAEPRRRSLFDD